MVTLQGIAVLAALVIAVLVIIWILNILKATLWAGLCIIVIIALLYFGFGITPTTIWDAFWHLPDYWQALWR